MADADDHGHGEHTHSGELLSPLELHILDLCAELTGSIAGLVGDDDIEFPLGEFDQRLLLEHTQIIERYVLAQAAARAYPARFRALGKSVPQAANAAPSEHSHGDGGHQHYVTDTSAAREAHSQGRAIIGEHPWAHEHGPGSDHDHADEWQWEPIDSATTE